MKAEQKRHLELRERERDGLPEWKSHPWPFSNLYISSVAEATSFSAKGSYKLEREIGYKNIMGGSTNDFREGPCFYRVLCDSSFAFTPDK